MAVIMDGIVMVIDDGKYYGPDFLFVCIRNERRVSATLISPTNKASRQKKAFSLYDDEKAKDVDVMVTAIAVAKEIQQ